MALDFLFDWVGWACVYASAVFLHRATHTNTRARARAHSQMFMVGACQAVKDADAVVQRTASPVRGCVIECVCVCVRVSVCVCVCVFRPNIAYPAAPDCRGGAQKRSRTDNLRWVGVPLDDDAYWGPAIVRTCVTLTPTRKRGTKGISHRNATLTTILSTATRRTHHDDLRMRNKASTFTKALSQEEKQH